MSDFPFLTVLIVLPLVGAIVTAALPQGHAKALPKQVALGVSVLTLVLGVVMAFGYHLDGGFQFTEDVTWIKAFGAHYAARRRRARPADGAADRACWCRS